MHCLIQRGTPKIWYAQILSHWREKFLVKFKGCIWNYQTTNPFQRWHPVLSQMLQDPLPQGSCWIMSTQTKPISNHVIVPPKHDMPQTKPAMRWRLRSFHIACMAALDFGGAHGRFPWSEQWGFRMLPVSNGIGPWPSGSPSGQGFNAKWVTFAGWQSENIWNLNGFMARLLKLTRVDNMILAPLPKNGKVSSLKDVYNIYIYIYI